MKFEIGKTYTFRNVSTEESVSYKKGDDGVYEDRVWTGGTWTFTIEDEDALHTLMDAQIKDSPPTFEFDDEGPYVGSSDTWSLDDCTSDWKAVLSEDSNYDKEEIEYKLNFVSGEHYLNDEEWEYLDGSFGSTIIVFENDSADE